MQNVILVCCDNQFINRQPHFFGNIARKNITKITRWNREANLTLRRAQSQGGRKIIDRLRQNSRPVDRVYPRQTHRIAKFKIVKHIFHACLTIVKITINRNRMHIALARRAHLAALHIRHSAMGIKNKHIHAGKPAECLNRRTAGIAARCPNNRYPLAAALQG